MAIATKVGTGASTPASGLVLAGTGAGTSTWRALTKSDVGLSNVDNTADSSKPVSTAQQTAIDVAITTAKQALYPVGCIYTETTGTNPNTTFGFGTWTAFGAGRVLIGSGTSDQAFAAGATGGESNHILTIPEMPAHTHTTTLPANATAGGTGNYFAGNNSGSLAAPSSSTGNGGSHNNLQPYIVVYFWQRAA